MLFVTGALAGRSRTRLPNGNASNQQLTDFTAESPLDKCLSQEKVDPDRATGPRSMTRHGSQNRVGFRELVYEPLIHE